MSDARRRRAPARCWSHARGVRKSYLMGGRALEVLRGIDLTVGRGEFLALRGASGAGKSTLLHLLGGLDLPNAGEIIFDGSDLRALPAARPGPAAQPPRRFCFPGLSFAARIERAGKCGAAGAHGAAAPAEAAAARGRDCWSGSVWASAWSTGLMNCPAASNSGWPSPAR